MDLRWYQAGAVSAVRQHVIDRRDGDPLVVLPTGAGKTAVIATLAAEVARAGRRCLVLSHRSELVDQSLRTIRVIAPEIDVGAVSAGLGEDSPKSQIVVAQIQSVFRRPEALGSIALAICDEAHMIPADGDGMWRSTIEGLRGVNPRMAVVGLTATPYRLDSGPICGGHGMFSEIVYEVGVQTLIQQGYLSKILSVQAHGFDASKIQVRGGEYVASSAEKVAIPAVETDCRDLVDRTRDRRSVLVFACGIDHAERIATTLRRMSAERVEVIVGGNLMTDRQRIVADFRAGSLKWLVNVEVLTTGFDAPNVDAVALMRPTMSPGLYYQMCGRGLRICSGKEDCLVVDYAGNLLRHGPIDDPRMGTSIEWTLCEVCGAIHPADARACPKCNAGRKQAEKQKPERIEGDWRVVDQVLYYQHTKRNAGPEDPKTLRVEYYGGGERIGREWVCLNHRPGSFPHRKALDWLRARGIDEAITVAEAVELGIAGQIAEPGEVREVWIGGSDFPIVECRAVEPPGELQGEPDEFAPQTNDWEVPF
ncbi:MAG: DEAD/DEAH box helicase [Caulobacteraceae bacterium]|nr:DEAD/DEAH box helicase [Caulobacteraceae bacterium]